MKSLLKVFTTLAATAALSMTAHASPVATCSVNDFLAGGSPANDCSVGTTANDSPADISALWSGGWSAAAKYENGKGLEAGSTINLLITAAASGFDWSIDSKPFKDAVFVVKQANPNSANPGGWIAYLFEPLKSKSGSFTTTGSFAVNDYSHVSLYTRGNAVPEMDAAGAGMALALLSSLLVLVRERRSC